MYRYGFNGHEKDFEVKNITGGHLDFTGRVYDPRLGRFFSTDPWEDRYAWQSPFAYFKNSPIAYIDFNGYGGDPRVKVDKKNKTVTLNIEFNFNKDEGQSDADFEKAKVDHMDQVCNDLSGKTARWRKKEYTVNINVSEGNGSNAITVNFNLNLDRSNAIKNGYVQNINPSHNSATHETLHNLGLSDRYSYTQARSRANDGTTVVSGTFGYTPISLKAEYDLEYYGAETNNIMWINGTEITTRQWKHIIGRRAERDHKQTTFFHAPNNGNRYNGPMTYKKQQVGYWFYDGNKSYFRRVIGYDIYYNVQKGRGSSNSERVNTIQNQNNLNLPYE